MPGRGGVAGGERPADGDGRVTHRVTAGHRPTTATLVKRWSCNNHRLVMPFIRGHFHAAAHAPRPRSGNAGQGRQSRPRGEPSRQGRTRHGFPSRTNAPLRPHRRAVRTPARSPPPPPQMAEIRGRTEHLADSGNSTPPTPAHTASLALPTSIASPGPLASAYRRPTRPRRRVQRHQPVRVPRPTAAPHEPPEPRCAEGEAESRAGPRPGAPDPPGDPAAPGTGRRARR